MSRYWRAKLTLFFACNFHVFAAKRPNVIIILADDLGIGDVGVYNSQSKVPTPNIDRLAHEGFRFLDAHAASSRCGPSRYALMTGRYSLDKHRNRTLKPGTPHLGELFKAAGYITGILGKHQPIDDMYELIGQTEEDRMLQRMAKKNYTDTVWGEDGRQSNEPKYSFFQPGEYKMTIGPHTSSYDYSFLERGPCCTPGGGYFENGIGVKPFDTWAIQRHFPEHRTSGLPLEWTDVNTGQTKSRPAISGYVGPPYFRHRTNGPVLVANYPPSILVQRGFDTRYAENRVNKKVLSFIDRASQHTKKPFFLYYGMRSVHKPFNAPIEYRNKSDAGLVGDSLMELDDNVGHVLDRLDRYGLKDNTVIVFMSDNGADPFFKALYSMTGHHQNSFDINGKHEKLQGGKESLNEGGHRLPMIWHWPKGIKPGTNSQSTVSYIDVFATLADIIGVKLECNQAPDSRSLTPLFNRDKLFDKKPIIHHGIESKKRTGRGDVHLAIRSGKWKLIDSNPPELYDMSKDPGETENVYADHLKVIDNLRKTMAEMVKSIEKREKETDYGRIKNCL